MKRQVAQRKSPSRLTVSTWILIAVFAAALLAACDTSDGSTDAPGSAVTPAPALDAEGAPLPDQTEFREDLLMSVEDVRAAAYSPDGSQIALSSGNTIWLFTAELDRLRELKGHTAPVRALAWSPDGTRIASAALDNTARIWDTESGSLLTTLSGHTNWVMDVDWSPDGARIVTASTDHTLRLWDAASGEELIELGISRVESLLVTFDDDAIFDVIAEMNYAETVLATVANEPLSDLVEQMMGKDYSVAIAFDDPAWAERLLRLDGSDYRVQIRVDDETLSENLDELSASELIDLAMMLDDAQIEALLAEYSEAEAIAAAINARDDANMIRTLQRLRNQQIVIVIERADGETTTTNPAEEDFIATLAKLGSEDVTITFGIENEAAISAALQNPDFVAAVQQYDAAQETLAALTVRDDATLLLLVRQLQAREYAITLANGDVELDADLSTIDNANTIHLITLLHDADLLATLHRLAAVDFVVSDMDSYSISELSGALAPLEHHVVITVESADLSESLAALSRQDTARLADLINSAVLHYALQHADDAQATLDKIAARDDFALITAVRKLENARTVETIISAPPGSNEARVTHKHNTADYVLTLALNDEDTIRELSPLSDGVLAEQFAAQDTASLLAQIDAGIYTLAPALNSDDAAALMSLLSSDMLAVSVQREANGHGDSVMSAAWSLSGDTIASTSADLTVRLWEPDSDKLVTSFELGDIGIALAWSPEGLLANGGWTNSVILWDVRDGAEAAEEFAELKGPEKRILDVTWSPDGTAIAAGDRDGMVTVWDVASGNELHSFAAHDGETRAVAWSPDGSTILSAGTDGTVRLWSAATASGE